LRIIIEFIKSNPYCNIQEVVEGVENMISRVTVYKLVHELIENGAVKRHLENDQKRNARDHKLFVDEGNPLVSMRLELVEFENAFFDLFTKLMVEMETDFTQGISDSKAKGEIIVTPLDPDTQLNSEYIQDNSESRRTQGSVRLRYFKSAHILLSIFYAMVDACLFRLLFIWSGKISNQQVIQQLYSMVFSKIANMQIRLSESFKSRRAILGNIITFMSWMIAERFRRSDEWFMGSEHGESMFLKYLDLDLFKKSNLEKEIGLILDALWKIIGELQRVIYPEPKVHKLPFKYGEDDWRKLVHLLKKRRKSTPAEKDYTKLFKK